MYTSVRMLNGNHTSRQQLFDNIRRDKSTSHLYMTDDKPIVIAEVDEGPDPYLGEVERIYRGGRIRGHAF